MHTCSKINPSGTFFSAVMPYNESGNSTRVQADNAQRQPKENIFSKHFKYLLFFPLAAFALAGCAATPSQMYWDHKVKELCEKDGGVTVYEHIELTPEEFKKLGGNQFGEIDIPLEQNSNQSLYFISLSKIIIHSGNPEISRTETKITRRSDMKVMSMKVNYFRGGGDLIELDHPSHISCKSFNDFDENIVKETIQIKGDAK